MIAPRASFLAAAAFCAAALAACQPPPPSLPLGVSLPHERFAITVRETRERLDIPVASDKTALSWDERDAVDAVAAEYLARGHGAIVVALPQGSPNHEAAVRNAAEVRDRLYAQGVRYSDIRGARYDAGERADAPLVIGFVRFSAEAPSCHERWDDFARTSTGSNTRNFGCAGAANLAAMIADPHDLLAPRGEDPSDGTRRAEALEKYRTGRTTATLRSSSERSTVSEAVAKN